MGWALTDMAGAHRATWGGFVCTAVGVTLLADTQSWASDALPWSSLAIAMGLAILIGSAAGHDRQRKGDGSTTIGGRAL